MSNTLILNSSNATAQSNTFQYNFISSGFEIKRCSKIAVSSITIPKRNEPRTDRSAQATVA